MCVDFDQKKGFGFAVYRHTGVVVYGNEYFFGGGIQSLPAGTTPYGRHCLIS